MQQQLALSRSLPACLTCLRSIASKNDLDLNSIARDRTKPETTTVITQKETNLINVTSPNNKTEMSPSTSNQNQSSTIQRPTYVHQEDNAILRFILDGKFEALSRGNKLWQKMEDEGICPGRSWESMKNRYKRNIYNNLSRFHLTDQEIERLKKPAHAAYDTAVRSRLGLKKIRRTKKKTTSSKENVDEI